MMTGQRPPTDRFDSRPVSPRVGDHRSSGSAAPRVVYFIASHRNPEQVVRLARACRSGSPESRVIVHHDYSASDLDPKLLEPLGNVHVMRAESACTWGGFGTCALLMRCMRWLVDHHPFDWVCHISGQDYPIRPVSEIESDLARSPYDGYVLSYTMDEVPWDVGAARYLYRYRKIPRFPGWQRVRRVLRSHQKRRIAAGAKPFLSVAPSADTFELGLRPRGGGPFRDGFECYKGSAWWTLNRRSVEHLINFADRNPNVVEYYKGVRFASDESFAVTILRNNPELNLVTKDHRRFIRWSNPQTGHPDMLTRADLPKLLASGKDFARKIDGRKDADLLDLLDERIGVRGPLPAVAV